MGGEGYDVTGARPSPAFPYTANGKSCVSLYGDSFTRSPQSPEDAWGDVLARLLDCRVANFGVGGYGTDQAYLRFQQNKQDGSEIVILSHTVEDILRNLTRDRDLLTYVRWYAFKPRFVYTDQQTLEYVPIPRLSSEEHNRLIGLKSPQLELERESFYPGGPAGAVRLRFPFTYSILRNLDDFRMRARFSGEPSYAQFYAKNHPLRGLEITREILKLFVIEAQGRGKRSLVMILPGKNDFMHYRKTRRWTYQSLVDELNREGISPLDFGPLLVGHIGSGDMDGFFDHTGHYNKKTDRLLAQFVYANLARIGLTKNP